MSVIALFILLVWPRSVKHSKRAMIGRLFLCTCLLVLSAGQGGGPGGGKRPPGPGDRQPKPPKVDGAKDTKQLVLASNGFNVEVNGNGNAPFYVYWADGKEDAKQRVMFAKMWQTDSLDNPGAAGSKRLKPVNLIGAYDWVFTDVTDKTSTAAVESTFKMTGKAKEAGSKDQPKPDIVFTNHLVSTANGTELKFDVDISNFADDWWDASAAGLVMAYRIQTLDGANAPRNMTAQGMKKIPNAERPSRPVGADGTRPPKADAIDLGNGYGFESVQTATSGTATVKATTAVGVEERMPHILVTYAKFSQTLRHDPTIYNTASSTAEVYSSTSGTVTYDENGQIVSGNNNKSASSSLRASMISVVAMLVAALTAIVSA